MFQPETLTVTELLHSYAAILSELRTRGIVRTGNNPVGDYAEWLVAQKLNLVLSTNSAKSHDAVDTGGIRYQIKARRVTPKDKVWQLSSIRNLEGQGFDYLIAIIFNEDFGIKQVVKVSHTLVCEYVRYQKHVNGHVLDLGRGILKDDRIEDITALFY